jgi:hypothetical protein
MRVLILTLTQVTRLHECTHSYAGKSSLDALEAGVNAVELDTQDQYYVGLGGLPNAKVSMGGIISATSFDLQVSC